MNVFIAEMKAHRKSLVIWAFSIIFAVVGGMGKYVTYSASGQSMNELFSQMPKSMLAIFGIGGFDLSKASGYYGMLFSYLLLMATVHAAMLGADIISKEERDKTAEFLFSKPISRSKIITSKLLAGLINIIIFNIITLVSSILTVGSNSKGESIDADIVILMVAMFILQLMFMTIGTAIASIIKRPKTVRAVSTAVLLITYILSIAIDINSKLEGLKYFTPFKYYGAEGLIAGNGFELSFVVLSVIIIVAMISSTYIFYKKRDLTI